MHAALTRRHVKSRAAPKVRGEIVRGCKAKVGQLDRHSLVRHQDVLGLEVPVVDPEGVAELHGIQQLQKHTLDQGVVADKVPFVGDTGEEITLRAVFHYDVGTVLGIHDAGKGHDVGMLAGQMVQTDLTLLVLELAGVQPSLVECLDRIADVGVDVQGRVDDPVGADTEDAGEFQAVGQDES